jgi:hypothetical protein
VTRELRRVLGASLVLLAAALPSSPGAQPYDPSFRWRTLETPHFRIHFHDGEELIVQQVAREAERAHALLAPRLEYAPRRTEIVLSDDVDDANGSATPVPYNIVRLYAVPPSSGSELQDYRSWLRQLIQHEYTHILHLDHIGGIPRFVNAVFGKVWPPNGFQASFFLEGVAVVNESEGDPGAGRNASAMFDMEARALALDGPFPRLDEVANQFLQWPVGQVPYLLGGRFMGFLQARYGPRAVAGYIADEGSVVWPYAPSGAGRRWFGDKEFPELWDEYAAWERAYAEGRRAWVHTRPVTAATPLTRRGGDLHFPRFSPDGSFVLYRDRGLDERAGLRRVALDGRDLGRVTAVDANGALAVASPGEAVVAIGEVFHEYRVYDDLYRVDLASGARRPLTRGARASDPDVGRDGTLVYVRHAGGGTMALLRQREGGGEPEVLYAHRGAEVFRPRVAPDGRVAFELHEGGRRDIAVWRDGQVERVTDDDALDTAPAWTPDGRFLLFASDRGGVFNLYAWESATGRIRQVTNVELGAYEPDVSPDGRTIVFVTYSRAGFDLATLPLDEATWLEPLPSRPAPPLATWPTAAEAHLPDPIPSHPYSPWSTVAPTFWLPLVSADAAGPIYGALTGGVDVLVHHAWAAEGWWSPKADRPGYRLAYQGGWSWPALDFSSGLTVTDAAGPPDRLEQAWNYADVGATFTFTRLDHAVALRLGWSGTGYRSLEAQAPLSPASEPFRFRDGFLSEATFLARYTDARRFTRSISPEEGRTLTLTLGASDREIGSDYHLLRARANATQYLRVPGTRHVVLVLNAGGGVADGTIGDHPPFELGGATAPDPLALLPGTATAPSSQLRGYPVGALGGTGFVAGNLELRLPLFAPTYGRSTWPIFLRRVHGALFLDGGDAFDLRGQLPLAGHALAAEELRFSAGAEVRLELVLAYYLRTDLRIGVARPLGALFGRGRAADEALGIDLPQVAWYVAFGSTY